VAVASHLDLLLEENGHLLGVCLICPTPSKLEQIDRTRRPARLKKSEKEKGKKYEEEENENEKEMIFVLAI